MAFDFDTFINKACVGEKDSEGNVSVGIFGRSVTYIPANTGFDSFPIAGDFHKSYEEVKPDTMSESSITSEQIVVFIRKVDMPEAYPKPQQGDYVEIKGFRFQVIDVQIHIPGSLKLVLYEEQ